MVTSEGMLREGTGLFDTLSLLLAVGNGDRTMSRSGHAPGRPTFDRNQSIAGVDAALDGWALDRPLPGRAFTPGAVRPTITAPSHPPNFSEIHTLIAMGIRYEYVQVRHWAD